MLRVGRVQVCPVLDPHDLEEVVLFQQTGFLVMRLRYEGPCVRGCQVGVYPNHGPDSQLFNRRRSCIPLNLFLFENNNRHMKVVIFRVASLVMSGDARLKNNNYLPLAQLVWLGIRPLMVFCSDVLFCGAPMGNAVLY